MPKAPSRTSAEDMEFWGAHVSACMGVDNQVPMLAPAWGLFRHIWTLTQGYEDGLRRVQCIVSTLAHILWILDTNGKVEKLPENRIEQLVK
jgi:hypothetical protein